MTGRATPALRVMLVDDEPLARMRLRQLLAPPQPGMPTVEVVGEAGDAAEALAALQAAAGCDLVLLDIALPGRSGLALAEALQRLPAPPAVVFVTAHADHALRAFDLDAADYLTKPVRRERLLAALQRVLVRRRGAAGAAEDGRVAGEGGMGSPPPTATAAAPPVLVVSDRGRVLRVPVAEVLYCKAELKYVTLATAEGQWLLDDALADLEQRLGPAFLRVHRNALVAVAAVRALERAADAPAGGDSGDSADTTGERWVVRLANGDALAVSRRQLPAVREVLAGRR